MKKTVMIDGDEFVVDGNTWVCEKNKMGFKIILRFAEKSKESEEAREAMENFVAKHILYW